MTYIDQYTKLLIHADGTEGSNSFTDFSPSGHSITATASKTFTFTRPDGEDIGEGWFENLYNTGGSVTIYNNKLRVHKEINTGQNYSAAMNSFDIQGDFDIQVDYDVFNFPKPSMGSMRLEFYVQGYNTAGGTNYVDLQLTNFVGDENIKFAWRNDNITGYSTALYDYNTVGKFRITRTGTTLTAYHWYNSTWTQVGQLINGWTVDVNFIMLRLYGAETDVSATVDFDNFQINSGTVVNYPSPIISTTTKKFGTGSAYFGGDVSYLSIPDSEDWNFGSDDFTIDFWANFKEYSNSKTLLAQYYDSENYWYIHHSLGSTLLFFHKDANSIKYRYTYSFDPTPDQWYHIAFERLGTVAKLFINGEEKTLSYTVPFGSNSLNGINTTLKIGSLEGVNELFEGYIDELRISKGIARWTENFTPPGAAYRWPMIGGNLAEAAKIIVIEESDNSLISATDFSAGDYEIEVEDTDVKTIIARKSDGQIVGYGNVTPL